MPDAAVAMARAPSVVGRARAATIEAPVPRSNIRQVSLRAAKPAAATAATRSRRAAAKPAARAGTRAAAARAARTRRVMEQGDGGRMVRVSTPAARRATLPAPVPRGKPARRNRR
jgi:D-alanyl-D-alanine carboxypeptidase